MGLFGRKKVSDPIATSDPRSTLARVGCDIPPKFSASWLSASQPGDLLLARSLEPLLRGIQWQWNGGKWVDVRLYLNAETPVFASQINEVTLRPLDVWDLEKDRARFNFSPQAFEEGLADSYSDPDILLRLIAAARWERRKAGLPSS